MLPAAGKILAGASWHLHMLLKLVIPVLWSAQAALGLQLHSSSCTHLKAMLQFLQMPASELVLCPTTHLRIQKHLQKGGGDSNKVMQKPQHLLHLFVLLLQSLE